MHYSHNFAHQGHYYRAIMNISIISVKEIRISAQNMNLSGTSIQLFGQDGTRYAARYNDNSRTYVITGNQSLTPGVTYRVMSDTIQIPPNQSLIAIPNLILAKQTAPNQVEIVYDRPTEPNSALKITNYWIRVNRENPVGIGTVGMGDSLTAENSLKSGMASIRPMDQSNMRFVLIFNTNAARGVQHEVQPCFVNEAGSAGYGGENWTSESNNKFLGR